MSASYRPPGSVLLEGVTLSPTGDRHLYCEGEK